MCVLDVALGKLSSTRMLKSYRSTTPPSVRGSTLLLRDSSSCVEALNISSLDAKFQLTYQKESLQPECQTVEWAGWSSSGQILIIWSTCDQLLVAVHEHHSGSLQAMHRIENGHFERFNRDNVSPAPHHPFLAVAYREAGTDDEDDDYEIPRPGHQAAILCLATGQLHPVVYGGDSESLQCWASWDWAPSGLAVVFRETSSGEPHNLALHIWHAPSASTVYSARGQCETLVKWSPNGRVCALVKGGEIEHVLHLYPTATKPAPAELYLEERHRPDYSDQPSRPGAQNVYSISPCSTRLVACGGNLPVPSRIEHWKLALTEGCFDYEPVTPPLIALESRRPVVAWYPSACIYAVVVGHTTVQIICGRSSKPLASWPVFDDGHDGSGPQEPVYALSWSPDGQKLVCRGPERLAIFQF